ncbi:MAG: hypothetical protein DRP66_05035 [Planctomycetota bacterium]|nr:MAG: hypothetical protein DRP66_05035 [Planctomycetota bacterium]
MNTSSQNKEISVVGIIFTVIVTLGFIWAALQWLNRYNRPAQLTSEDMRANEIQAFKNLRRISQAQEKYKQTDRDGDGKKKYAKFFTHLWRCVNIQSEATTIKLIPKDIAFAVAPSFAIDGYYFINLYSRALSAKGQTRKLDYEKEWAVAAIPADPGNTGSLIFIADNSSDIFMKKYTEIPSYYPHDPHSNGWTKIESIKQLNYTP